MISPEWDMNANLYLNSQRTKIVKLVIYIN